MEDNSNGTEHQPTCLLAHSLLNKLSVIVGFCQLLEEEARSGTALARRAGMIHDMAKDMGEEIVTHQCRLSEADRSRELQKLKPDVLAN